MSIIQGNAKQGSTRGFYPKVINGSLRFNDDDSAYLSWTPASAGNRKTWTWSGWVKRGNLGATLGLFSSDGTDDATKFELFFSSGDQLGAQGNSTSFFRTTQVFRDPSAWYHIVLVWDAVNTTINVYVNGVQVSDWSISPTISNTDYGISRNAEHYLGSRDGGGSNYDGYLADVHFIDGQALTADDFGELKNGVWVAKDYAGTFGTNGFYLTFEDDTQVEAFNTVLYRGNGSGNQSITGMGMNADLYWIKRRDAAGGWNCVDTVRGPHKRLELHSTGADYNQTLLQSFDSDGFTTGVTGVGESGGSYVAFGWDAGANNAVTGHSSVTYTGSGTDNMEVSGFPFSPDLLWIKERNGTEYHNFFDTVRGSNKILFSNVTNAEVTDDNRVTSFTSNGFKVGTDSATNTSGDTYVAWAWDAGDSDLVSNTDGSITSTVKSSGDFSVITYTGVGPASAANEITVGHGLTSKPDFVIVKRRNSTGDWFVFTDIVDGSNDYLYLNQTAAKGDSGNSVPTDTVINLGGSLNTSGGTYVAYAFRNVTGKQKFGTYSGTGSDVTVNVGFRAGFLLVKWTGGGGASAENWAIVDASRDPINNLTKGLFPNTSGAEQDSALNNEVEFTSTGFVVKNTDARWNANGGTYIYAAFAGSYSDYITDYNTDGSIDSRVKASDTTGFSIVSYTGTGANATWGHGLSSAPDMVIVKRRTNGLSNWHVYHSSLAATQIMELSTTAASQTDTPSWNSTAPTNSVVSVGTSNATNMSGESFIAYCWSETTGYSKFGSYTGTGSAGNTVTGLGFTPAFLMIKGSDVAEHWMMYDNTRSVVNPIDDYLLANGSGAEATGQTARSVDFDSDGFTVDGTGTEVNQAGKTYIYAAFADTREAAFWLDQSGNDNDWQPVNLDHNDTVLDSPTDNFATWNPIAPYSGSTYSEGNLKVTTGSSQYGPVLSTIAVSSGKYYVEFTQGSGSYTQLGCVSTDKTLSTTIGLGSGNNSFAYVQNDGSFRQGSVTTSGYGDTWTTGDVIGMALDLDNDEVTYYKNGVSQGTVSILNASVGLTSGKTYFIALSDNDAGGGTTVTANFGQQPFKYDPPA